MAYMLGMRTFISVARTLLGVAFIVFGLNYFVPFLPPPGHMPSPTAMQFIGGFAATGLLTLIKGVEIAAGLMLVANRFVGLALALLAPILVGIVGYHASLAPEGIAVGLGLLALELVLAWGYRGSFAAMLAARQSPSALLPRTLPADVAVGPVGRIA